MTRDQESQSDGANAGPGKVQRYTSIVLAASTLLLVMLFAASLFIPVTRQNVAPSSAASAPQSLATAATSEENSGLRALSGNPLLASIIVVVLTFLIIERVRDINSRITELDKGLRDNNSKIQKSVEDATESQVKRLNERLDNLKGKIDGFERRYPWLQTINESSLVINVNSSVAILETVAGLILSQQRAAAYEWLAGAAKDNDTEGLPLDFLAIAAVCRLFFNDRVLAEKFIARAENASKYSMSWRVAKLMHLLETGQYSAASSLVFDIERRLLPGIRMRLRMALDARYRRQPKTITPELIAALRHYYTTIGDSFGLERVYPNLLKKVPKPTLTLAEEIYAALLSTDPDRIGDLKYWRTRANSQLTGILLAEAHIHRAVLGQKPDWPRAHAAVEFAHHATGNQAFAKALSACVKELERSNLSVDIPSSADETLAPSSDKPDGIVPNQSESHLEVEKADPDPFALHRKDSHSVASSTGSPPSS